MSSSTPGGPAFPCKAPVRDSNGALVDIVNRQGMSLRDYIAVRVLPTAFNAQELAKGLEGECAARLARFCYYIADAMLAERKKAEETFNEG